MNDPFRDLKSGDSSPLFLPASEPIEVRRQYDTNAAMNRRTPRGHLAAQAVFPALLLLVAAAAQGASVESQVREGVAAFRQGKTKEAAAAFDEAAKTRPQDPWIQFDHACALAAQGEADKAGELYRKAAMSRDAGLAVRSRYNLGNLAASRARKLFGPKPEEATEEVRRQGMDLLREAVGHYRDCLDLDARHADARHNLEAIRLWIKHMEALWQERDRQKQRQEMNLLEFLAMLEARQRELRLESRALGEEADSPRRRQAAHIVGESQRKLAEEIEPLVKKIREALAPPPAQGASQAPPPDEDRKRHLKLLEDLAGEARKLIEEAAGVLESGDAAGAVAPQTSAVERFDDIFLGVVPFPSLVQKSVERQGQVVGRAEEASKAQQESPDVPEIAWDQSFVPRWARMLHAQAKAEQSRPKPLGPEPPPSSETAADGKKPTAADEPKAAREALQKAMAKAEELAPKIRELTLEATDLLRNRKPAESLPEQQEALKLLQEIADLLPKQKPQDEQKKQEQQKQDQKKDDQKKQDQKGDQKQEPQKEQSQQQKRDLSREEAEAMIRKVRDRERQRREKGRVWQAVPVQVEKDW